VELQGPLWEGVLPVVLRRIYVRRRTGELTLRYEREVRRVLFHGGNITNAATNVREDRMGELLVRQGRLSEADLKRATGFVLRDSKLLGAVLVDLGILNQATLREVVAAHVDTVLSRALSWSDGEYDFREVSDRPTGEEETTLPCSTGDLILRASRAVQDPDVVRYNLGDIDRVVSLSSDPLLRFQRLNLTAADRLVISAASGSLTARQIVERVALKREEARLSLFALLNTGIFEYPDRTGSFPSLPKKRPESPPSPAADAPVGVDRTHALSQVPLPAEPTMRMDALEPPEAPRGEPTIVLRREDLQAFLAGKLPEAPKVSLPLPDLAPPPEPTVMLSREALSSALALDSRRRDIVDKHGTLGRCTHFELLGISRDAGDAVIREAYFRLAKRFHPDAHHDVGLGDLRQELEAVFNELGEAYEVLRSPWLRARYERELAQGEVGAPAGAPAPTEIGDPEAALARAADSIARERHWEALPLLEAALPRVEGAARQRARVLLAQIYARDPDWVKQAEELLLAVVEQEPQHAEAHYYLGVIYRYQGLPSRALASFRKVVEITPDSADAWRNIAELDKQSVVPPEIALLLRKLLRRE
jgi:tetratricopeptide (TPR) repeat protein